MRLDTMSMENLPFMKLSNCFLLVAVATLLVINAQTAVTSPVGENEITETNSNITAREDQTEQRQASGDPQIMATVTCDNTMSFYADGVLMATNDDWTAVTDIALDPSTEVYAIECVDTGVVGGILASFSNGKVSRSTWKCSNTLETGWADPGFDDSNWSSAYEIGSNGVSPWGTLPTIAVNAKWIWTAADTWQGLDTHVYCRLSASGDPQIMATVTCDNTMSFYADGVLMATNPDWTAVTDIALDPSTDVYAIECVDTGGSAGILASFSNGKVSHSTWKCSNTLETGWADPGFDDSNWSSAYEIGSNGVSPWGTRGEVPTIAADAKWIWTAADTWQGLDTHVYCRLSGNAPEPEDDGCHSPCSSESTCKAEP